MHIAAVGESHNRLCILRPNKYQSKQNHVAFAFNESETEGAILL